MKVERNYGIDTLRIVAMFMVVILHVLGQGGVLQSTEEFSVNYVVAWSLEIAAYCAVNSYAIISGYVGYGRKIRYSSLIHLIFSVAYYVIILSILGYFFIPEVDITDVVKSVLHLRKGGYWYARAYFCAFFFFSYINVIVEKYEEKRLYILAGGMFLLFSVIPTLVLADVFCVEGGYSPFWLMIMYFVGAVMKKCDTGSNENRNKYLFLYILMVVLTLISKISIAFVTRKVFGRIILSEFLISYTSPTIVLSAVFLVRFFSKVELNKFAKKIVYVMSPLTFGVYLVHTQYFVWKCLENKFISFATKNPVDLFVKVILVAFIIYLISSFADYIRLEVFKILKIKNISERIEKKIFTMKDDNVE